MWREFGPVEQPQEAAPWDARRLRPIVALTANALKGEAKHCRDIGMDDYMTKPVQLLNLKAMLRKWVPPTPTPIPTPSRAASVERASSAPGTALDLAVLQALVGDDPQVIEEFLQDFRLSAGEAAVQMRAACSSLQPKAVEAIAHKLKSSARAVGAVALGDLCAHLEDASQADRLETLAELLQRFETEIAAVDKALELRHA